MNRKNKIVNVVEAEVEDSERSQEIIKNAVQWYSFANELWKRNDRQTDQRHTSTIKVLCFWLVSTNDSLLLYLNKAIKISKLV